MSDLLERAKSLFAKVTHRRHEALTVQQVVDIGALLRGESPPSFHALARRFGVHRNVITRIHGRM